ncbi:MAG: shikimate kinase [Betaproteobacteria bacterium]|nr:shikimate kinase [Betaproteobacteria bacterium]
MLLSEADNVILVGMMGCGKSTLGKQLARRLRRQFVDSDVELEHRSGVSIPMIFELDGEEGFRARETQVIADLTRRRGLVLATGGGAILSPENRSMLRASGMVIYLHASVAILYERTRRSKGRPLLNVPDPEQRLCELYTVRDPLYREAAHIVIESAQNRLSSLLERVMHGINSASTRPTSISAER